MSRSRKSVARSCAALLLAIGASVVVLLSGSPVVPEGTAATETVLEASNSQRWMKGNLHTHSLWSDGDDYLEMIAFWYRNKNYDFLAFTDHNLLSNTEKWIDIEKSKGGRVAFEKLKNQFPENWVEERTVEERGQVRLKKFDEVFERMAVPEKFLLIQAEEISDAFKGRPIHMNATNLETAIPPLHGESVADAIQNNFNAVLAQRERTGRPMMVHLNHPNFVWGVTAEDLMRIRGENFFEVYNGHPGVHNTGDKDHPSAERIWDIILTRRIAEFGLPLMYGLATDDGHAYHKIPSRASEPGRGWVVVLAEKLTPEKLIAAMEAGRFYSSSGVVLDRIASSSKSLEVKVRAEEGVEYTIEFIGTRKGFDPTSQPVLDEKGDEKPITRRYSADVGKVLKSVKGPEGKYEFQGDELYVRAKVVSSRPHPNPSEPGDLETAWVQPVRGPASGAKAD